MLIAIIVSVTILLLFFIGLMMFNQNIYIKTYKIKLEEGMDSIKTYQKTETETLNKISKKLNSDEITASVKELSKAKSSQLSEFEKEEKLHSLNKDIKDYFEYNKVDLDKDFVELIKKYKKMIVEKNALKLYYNSNCEMYNDYIKGIKHLLIKIIKKAKK